MPGFVIRGLDPAPFVPLYGLSDADLAARGVVRMMADPDGGSPCRVTLEDAPAGSRVLLLNHEHLPAPSPYRARHAIFVREGAVEAAHWVDAVPRQLARRLLSLRAYDAAGMMVAAEVLPGETLAERTRALFADPAIAFLHAHNAAPGCFAARIDRG